MSIHSYSDVLKQYLRSFDASTTDWAVAPKHQKDLPASLHQGFVPDSKQERR